MATFEGVLVLVFAKLALMGRTGSGLLGGGSFGSASGGVSGGSVGSGGRFGDQGIAGRGVVYGMNA